MDVHEVFTNSSPNLFLIPVDKNYLKKRYFAEGKTEWEHKTWKKVDTLEWGQSLSNHLSKHFVTIPKGYSPASSEHFKAHSEVDFN